MGFRDSWIAVFDRRPPPADLQLGLFGPVESPPRAPPPPEIADLLGMPCTGERAELLDVGVHAVALPTLWTVVVASGADHLGRLTPADAERLSRLGFDAVYLEHSEGTGRARLEVYEGGRRVWGMRWGGELETVGDVPAHLLAPGYGAVLSAGRALTGFLHDVQVVVPGTPEPYWACDAGRATHAAEDAWALGGEGPVEGWGRALRA